MFTITGITSIVLTYIVIFKELLLKGLPNNRKGQWWQKGIYSCPLKVSFDGSLCILCMAFLQKLYFARVSHDLIQFVLKMADLSILMEPTLLPEIGSATSLRKHPFLLALRRWGRSQLRRARRNGCFRRLVSYSILQRFWVMLVS